MNFGEPPGNEGYLTNFFGEPPDKEGYRMNFFGEAPGEEYLLSDLGDEPVFDCSEA